MTHSLHEQPTDEQLLASIRADADGTRRADIGRLLGRYSDRVYAWCYRHVRDEERALDLAQEVMIAAFRHLDGFRGGCRFSTWLFSIARNRCLSELRRPALLVDPETDPEVLVGRGRDPERELIETMDLAEVLTLMRSHLEPLEQEALCLRAMEGLSVEAITELLGIDQGTGARTVLQTARRKLRAALARRRRKEVGGSR